MYIGYYTKMESSLITQHVLLGWVVYGVGIFLFLFFYSRKKFITTSEIAAVEQADCSRIIANYFNIYNHDRD